jgi:tetratricopeptide (TPR) repeat protein
VIEWRASAWDGVCSERFLGVGMLKVYLAVVSCLLIGSSSAALADALHDCAKLSGDAAIQACDQAIRQNPSDAVSYDNRGVEHRNKGDLDRAIADFTKAIEVNPKFANAYNNRGLVFYDKGDLDRAFADFDKAIEINPKFADAYNNRGLVFYDKGDLDRAIADYDKATEINPNYAKAYNNRGRVFDDKGDLDRALAEYTKATAIDPKNFRAYYNRGNAWSKKGDLDRAIADYDKAIAIDPKNAFAYNNRGRVFDDKGDLDRALVDFTKAIEIDPKHVNAYYNRGNAWSKKGDLDRAIADYNEAIRLDPRNMHAYVNRGLLFKRTREFEKASSDFHAALEFGQTPGNVAAQNTAREELAALAPAVAVAPEPAQDRLLVLRNWSDPPGLIRLPRDYEVTYEQVARNPSDFVNAVITMSGKIVQTMDEGALGFLRVNVTPLGNDVTPLRDMVLVEYPIDRTAARLLDGDTIRFAARFLGIKSYKTVLGATVQVPYFKCIYTPKRI